MFERQLNVKAPIRGSQKAHKHNMPERSFPSIDNILTHDLLSKDELHHYIRLAKQGDIEARNRVVRANMRLVAHHAKRFMDIISLDDLLQAGAIGLIKAIDRFDPDKGFQFSTYASWWILQSMQRAINAEHGYNRDKQPDIRFYSLDYRLDGEDEDDELLFSDIVMVDETDYPEVVADENLKQQVVKEVRKLPYPVNRIIAMFWGIGYEKHSFKEIAKTLNISPERVSSFYRMGTRLLARRLEKYLYWNESAPDITIDGHSHVVEPVQPSL